MYTHQLVRQISIYICIHVVLETAKTLCKTLELEVSDRGPTPRLKDKDHPQAEWKFYLFVFFINEH